MNLKPIKSSIAFVHAGENAPPEYLVDALMIAAKVAPRSVIYVLINRLHIAVLQSRLARVGVPALEAVRIIPIEDIPKSSITTAYFSNSTLDRSFREGFWFSASYRFFLLADFMQSYQIENCVHLENDVALYFDPSDKVAQLRGFARFAVPLDRVRAIPGIVWFKDAQIAKELALHISSQSEKNDMDSLGEFCLRKDLDVRPLPTLPLAYAKSQGLDLEKYCAGIDVFGGIFDAAAIGQYLGGVHWMNDPNQTRFFTNESSDLDMRECEFSWERDHYFRYPTIAFNCESTKVLSLHAHSKDLLGISPFNSGAPEKLEQMITGERLQALANITISSAGVTQFHGPDNIKTKVVLEISEAPSSKALKSSNASTAPDLSFIKQCQQANVLFVYTHLIPYFKQWIAPRLNQSFILISHNSDDAVTIKDLDLLNHPQLHAWFAQNGEFSHSKLRALPIGLANSQWGAERLVATFKASQTYRKTKSIYVNFSASTHPGRKAIFDVLADLPGVTQPGQVPYPQYIAGMAEHQFCLCPRGNGIDTHRFWEAQYVDCIPILLKQDWTQAYSNLPVLLLDAWSDLRSINLAEKYIEISTTAYDRSSLTLDVYRKKISFLEEQE